MRQEVTSPEGRDLPVGRRIEQAAAENNIEWAELARQVGVTESLLYKWRKGRVIPGPANLKRIAETLDRPVAWFFSESEAAA